jgi:hypothetical protein
LTRNADEYPVCINQTDDAEKSEQVRSMGRIYATADKVHVWLGPTIEEDHVQAVFSMFKEKAVASDHYILRDEGSQAATTWESVPTATLIALSTFMSRPWFTRRWVLQEVALSRVVNILCGHRKLAWEWFRVGANTLNVACENIGDPRIHKYLLPNAIQTLENVVTLDDFKKERDRAKRREVGNRLEVNEVMLMLLWTYHTAKCADEHDRLFSLYRLLPNTEKTPPYPIDYRTHFVQTYTRFSTDVVAADLTFDFLNHAIAYGGLAQQETAWPSWVPSWNLPRKTRSTI